MTRIVVLLMALFTSGIFNSSFGQEGTYSLQGSIDAALANNTALKQNGLQVESASLNFSQAKNNRLPNVEAGINYGISNGRTIDPFTNGYINQQLASSNASLTGSVPIFKGFQIRNNIEASSLNYQASKLENQQEKDNLTLDVILAFLQVLNNEDILELTKQQSAITGKQVERLDALNREGAIAPATLYDMQGQYATDQLSIVNAANALENSKLALSQLMNVSYKKEMKLSREGLDMTVTAYASSADQVYSAALQTLSMVKAADLRVKAASKSIEVARADLYPTLSISGQLASNYSSAARNSIASGFTNITTTDYVVVNGNNLPVISKQTNFSSQKINYVNQVKNNLGSFFWLNLQIPIFSRFQVKTNIAKAKLVEKNSIYIAENTKTQLQRSIEQGYLNMTASFDKYKLLKQQVASFEESFRAAEIRFNLGALNSVDYLIVKNNLDRANLNLTTARYEYLLRTKVLDFYLGILKP